MIKIFKLSKKTNSFLFIAFITLYFYFPIPWLSFLLTINTNIHMINKLEFHDTSIKKNYYYITDKKSVEYFESSIKNSRNSESLFNQLKNIKVTKKIVCKCFFKNMTSENFNLYLTDNIEIMIIDYPIEGIGDGYKYIFKLSDKPIPAQLLGFFDVVGKLR